MEKKELKELRKETIKKLEELQSNLGYDTEETYCDMYNIMADYDNDAQDDLYLCDKLRDNLDVLDEELVQYYFQNNQGLERLFYATRGIEYADSIYKVNAYGNLENITTDDFKWAIQETIDALQEAMMESEDQE